MIPEKALIEMVTELQSKVSECIDNAFRKEGGVDNYFYGMAHAYTDVTDMIYELIHREVNK